MVIFRQNKKMTSFTAPIFTCLKICGYYFSLRCMATKYVWDKKTDEELQLWPSSSTERYMTRPFLPTGDINSRNRKTIVTSPQNLPVDSLARRGISAAALTSHKSGYYQSRSGAPFHLVIYTLKSRYPKAAFLPPQQAAHTSSLRTNRGGAYFGSI